MIVYICLILINISIFIILKIISNLRIYVNKLISDLLKTRQEVHEMKQEFSKINKMKYDKIINSLKENKKVTFKDAIKLYNEERKD
nr:MAG TPA: hypothetical protein [Caudoviricetes sp.]